MISVFTLDNWDAGSSPSTLALSMEPSTSHARREKFEAPTQLCRWSIHVQDIDYEPILEPEPEIEEQSEVDLQNPSSWAQWPQSASSFPKSMHESITQGSFTSLEPGGLPVAAGLITQSLDKDPNSLVVDALRFAIMAGNLELIGQLSPNRLAELADTYPLHLAAAFIDGGNSCCGVFQLFRGHLSMRMHKHVIDNLGHTVLDALMISILRSHTSVPPRDVSTSFRDTKRYPGEEKDICGRWDADSPAVRNLFRSGYSSIPTAWKHPFCHTSLQAVYHSILWVWDGTELRQPSGLFLQHCGNCGLELRLPALHSLVIVAFYLAESGRPGETMFGALTLLVGLIQMGADTSATADVSIEDILGEAEPNRCYHDRIDARSLMEKVPPAIISCWTKDCQIGWRCFLQTLRFAQNNQLESECGSDSDNESHDETCDFHEHLGAHCVSPKLGLLWACIQAELLTYRRIKDGDAWISDNFSMSALLHWLDGESAEFNTPLMEDKMMKEHNRCGWFDSDYPCCVAEEVCKEHFMNMDDFQRTSFIPQD